MEKGERAMIDYVIINGKPTKKRINKARGRKEATVYWLLDVLDSGYTKESELYKRLKEALVNKLSEEDIDRLWSFIHLRRK